MKIIRADELLAGDVLVGATIKEPLTVREVDKFAGLVIVEFEDSTATAPMPGGVLVEVQRS